MKTGLAKTNESFTAWNRTIIIIIFLGVVVLFALTLHLPCEHDVDIQYKSSYSNIVKLWLQGERCSCYLSYMNCNCPNLNHNVECCKNACGMNWTLEWGDRCCCSVSTHPSALDKQVGGKNSVFAATETGCLPLQTKKVHNTAALNWYGWKWSVLPSRKYTVVV